MEATAQEAAAHISPCCVLPVGRYASFEAGILLSCHPEISRYITPMPVRNPHMGGAVIRLATIGDIEVINTIYNHYVLHSTCTYDMDPVTIEQRRQWFNDHGPKHPVTVIESGGEVVGWGSLSPFRARIAYQNTVENSIYIRHDCHRRGYGRIILIDQIERARALGHHTIIAGVSAEQTASVRLHTALGFVEGSRLREVGYKFDQWLDVLFMQLML